jgi:hypothetical protein
MFVGFLNQLQTSIIAKTRLGGLASFVKGAFSPATVSVA